MAFRWRADDGPLLTVFGSPHQLKKKRWQSWTSSEKKSGSAHVTDPSQVRKLPGHHTVLKVVDTRHKEMSWIILPPPPSPELFHWNSLSPSVVKYPDNRGAYGTPHLVEKHTFLCYLFSSKFLSYHSLAVPNGAIRIEYGPFIFTI